MTYQQEKEAILQQAKQITIAYFEADVEEIEKIIVELGGFENDRECENMAERLNDIVNDYYAYQSDIVEGCYDVDYDY